MDIRYYDRGGKIYYQYYEQKVSRTGRYAGRAYRPFSSSGTVPDEIVAQGADAVRKYAEKAVKEDIQKQKEHYARFDEARRKVNVLISVDYQGIHLSGRIICRDDDLTVELLEPLRGSEWLAYGHGFAAAMAGRKVWKENGVLTDEAIESARQQLIDIYKKESSALKDIVKELNKNKDV